MTVFLTSNPGKAIFQNTLVQIAANDLFEIGAKEPVLPFEPLVIDQLECFEMVFHALIVRRVLRVALTVYGFRREFFHLLQSGTKPKASAKVSLNILTFQYDYPKR